MGRTSDAKERLIATAIVLIRARSYASVSVDDMCHDAGVRKGSFYHFFPSKRDLALAAVDAWWAQLRAELLEPSFATDLPPLDRIRRLFERVSAQHAATQARLGNVQGCPLGNLTLELSAQDEVMREKLDATFSHFGRFFEQALRDAVQLGDVPQDTDPEVSAQALLAYLYGTILLAKSANNAHLMQVLTPRALGLVALSAV